jgi:hypothetical protein
MGTSGPTVQLITFADTIVPMRKSFLNVPEYPQETKSFPWSSPPAKLLRPLPAGSEVAVDQEFDPGLYTCTVVRYDDHPPATQKMTLSPQLSAT